jgi:hypothetical protein
MEDHSLSGKLSIGAGRIHVFWENVVHVQN